ncbi:hypothetical protein M885DRAFT_15956 [Pelagophyceae sp. CCMP2097]|nr:hypothetical protein M885DRAFT_15956 [Pelagophyceae sp. CCMP2097]
MHNERETILSSLPLQILLYFDAWFAGGFFVYNCFLFIYKASFFYYPPHTVWLEVVVNILLGLLQTARIFMSSKSNKTEMLRPMIWSLALTPAAVTAFTYFVYLQLYVLRVDVIVNSIGLIFLGSRPAPEPAGETRKPESGRPVSTRILSRGPCHGTSPRDLVTGALSPQRPLSQGPCHGGTWTLAHRVLVAGFL